MTIAAAVLGIGITLWIIQASDIGIMYRRAEFNYVIGMPGMIFLRVLLLIVVPLIMTTIANGETGN
jgi:Na+/H+-dicarboxylate symporter